MCAPLEVKEDGDVAWGRAGWKLPEDGGLAHPSLAVNDKDVIRVLAGETVLDPLEHVFSAEEHPRVCDRCPGDVWIEMFGHEGLRPMGGRPPEAACPGSGDNPVDHDNPMIGCLLGTVNGDGAGGHLSSEDLRWRPTSMVRRPGHIPRINPPGWHPRQKLVMRRLAPT